MDALLDALLPAIAAVVVVLAWGLFRSRIRCPNCGTRLPMFRIPADTREAAWGGVTCRKCGMKLDRNGKPRS
jgi:hypothetical protein